MMRMGQELARAQVPSSYFSPKPFGIYRLLWLLLRGSCKSKRNC